MYASNFNQKLTIAEIKDIPNSFRKDSVKVKRKFLYLLL